MEEKKIQKYMVEVALSCRELSELVNEAIAAGWEPQGGVASACWENENGGIDSEYCQAMVKRA